jgi:hypothetical protein
LEGVECHFLKFGDISTKNLTHLCHFLVERPNSRVFGFFGRFCVSPMASLAFPLYFGFALYFGFGRLGFWVSLVGFGFMGVFFFFFGGLFGFERAFTVCWDVGLLWILGVVGAVWVLDVVSASGCIGCCECLMGFILLFLSSGFVRALLYTTCAHRNALCFFNKIASYLTKKGE